MLIFARLEDGDDDSRLPIIGNNAGVEDVVEFLDDFIFVVSREVFKDVEGDIVFTRGGGLAIVNGSIEFVIGDWSIHNGILVA